MKSSVDRNTTKDGKYIVKIGFRSTDPDDKSWSGWFASYLTSVGARVTYQHVELMFSDHNVTSVTQSPGTVHHDLTKLMSNRKYSRFYELSVTWEEEQRMQSYARKASKEKIPFNKCGMYWNFIPYCFSIDMRENAFFCSEYVVTLLQQIDLVSELVAYETSPNDLYIALENDSNFKTTMNDKFIGFYKNHNNISVNACTTPNKKHGLKNK